MIEIYLIGVFFTFMFAWGTFVAHFQRKYDKQDAKDYREDLGGGMLFALLVSVIWPIGIIITLCVSGFLKYGWTLYPPKAKP